LSSYFVLKLKNIKYPSNIIHITHKTNSIFNNSGLKKYDKENKKVNHKLLPCCQILIDSQIVNITIQVYDT